MATTSRSEHTIGIPAAIDGGIAASQAAVIWRHGRSSFFSPIPGTALTDYATGDTLTFDIRWGSGLWLNGDQTSVADLAGLHSSMAVYNYAGFSRAYLYYQHANRWQQVEEILVGQFSATIDFGAGTYGQVSNYALNLKGPTYGFELNLAGTYGLDETGFWKTWPSGVVLLKNGIPTGSITNMELYGNVFGGIALTAIAIGLVLALVSPLIRKGMHGVD